MKTIRSIIFITIFIVFGIIINACEKAVDTNMNESMADFDFITQDNESLSLEDLKGEWWITYMSYTDCRTICPRTTENMVSVQDELKNKDLYPHIVSFNVDPENDDLKDLKEYASEYDVDLDTWDFLTGYDFDIIQKISKESFHAALEKGAADQMSHSYMFYLVNPDGNIVKEYDGMGSEGTEELIDDVEAVLK